MKIGQFEIHSFVEFAYGLDGGMMFGVVPKAMWEKLVEPIEGNLIPMVNNLFVLTAHGKTIMFDTGLGDTLSEREQKVYNTEGNQSAMAAGLQSLDLTSADVDYVVLTHLHTDHAAGAVVRDGAEFRPRFENATYLLTREDFAAATQPNERTRAVYDPERYHALKASGRLEFIDGNSELFPGVRTIFTGGHTEGHVALAIESENQRLYYFADIFPTRHHFPVAYVPATDVYPLQSMAAKRKALPDIVESNTIVAFDHDPTMAFGRVRQDGRRFVTEPVT